MSAFFQPNINRWGRLVRLGWGLGLLVVAYLFRGGPKWGVGFFLFGAVFSFYQAARGWCLMRACGIKTKL